jgi:hypothetical protein
MSSRTLAIATLCCASLSACVVAPVGRPYGYDGYGYGPGGEAIVADIAPPAPYYETVPPLPYAGAVWIGGYWGWQGGRHSWVPGRYERSRPGYTWQPHRWVAHDNRWHLEGGQWMRH